MGRASPRSSRPHPLVLVAALGLGVVAGLVAVVVRTNPSDGSLAAIVLAVVAAALLATPAFDRFVVAMILVETSIPLDVFLGFRQDAADLSALPGLPVSLTTFIVGIAYFRWMLIRLAGLQGATPKLFTAISPFAFYVMVVVSSWFGAADGQLATFEVGLLLQMVLLFAYFVKAVDSLEEFRAACWTIVAVLAIQSIIMTALLGVGRSVEVGPFLARIDPGSFPRVAGTVGSPNAAGAFLTLLLLPSLAVLRSSGPSTRRIFTGLTVLLGSVMLVFTFSRGAWLGFAVGFTLFVVGGIANKWLRTGFVLKIAALGGLLGGALSSLIWHRLTSPNASPFVDRSELMRVAVQMIADHPLRGVGANNFIVALPDYLDPTFIGSFISVVHSKYLLVGSETGLLGLAAFLLFLATTIWRGWLVVRRSRGEVGILTLGLVSAFSGLLVHMYFDLFHGRMDTQILVVVAALIVAAWRFSSRAEISTSLRE